MSGEASGAGSLLGMVLGGASVPSVVMGAFFAWRWWVERADKKKAGDKSYEQTKREELDKLQMNVTAEQSNLITGLRTDGRDLRQELLDTRRDRDRGWDLARFWHGAAHDLLRQFRNLRHNAANMEQWIGFALARTPGLSEPNMDGVPERSPDLPLGLEDPLLRRDSAMGKP